MMTNNQHQFMLCDSTVVMDMSAKMSLLELLFEVDKANSFTGNGLPRKHMINFRYSSATLHHIGRPCRLLEVQSRIRYPWQAPADNIEWNDDVWCFALVDVWLLVEIVSRLDMGE